MSSPESVRSARPKAGYEAQPPEAPGAPGLPARRVLMMAYYFPPIRTSGTQRSVRFARHLSDFGWKPTILTVKVPRDRWVVVGKDDADEFLVHRAFELDLNGLIEFMHGALSRVWRFFGGTLKRNYFRDILGIPDPHFTWLSVPKAVRLMKDHDVLYVSCSPFSAALSASLVKVLSGKPLVVDFRDVWAPYAEHSQSAFHAWVVKRMERIVVRTADTVVLNTDGAVEVYREAHPEHADKFTAIPNGFDELPPCAEVASSGGFRILHVGNFYGDRTPRLLLEALADIGNPEIEFVQVGAHTPELEEFADRVTIRYEGQVDRDRALALMTTASLLYVRQIWRVEDNHHVAVAAKTYEYLATGLPILAEGPPGDNGDIVERYAANGYVVRTHSKDAVKAAVLKAYAERDSVSCEPNPEYVARYNPRALTERLAEQLQGVLERNGGPTSVGASHSPHGLPEGSRPA